MGDDEFSKLFPIGISGMPWPQTFEGKDRTYIGGIGSARNYVPNSRDQMIDWMNQSFYGDSREGRDRAEKIANYLDIPLGVGHETYNTTRAIGEGRFRDAAVSGVLAALPYFGKPARMFARAIRPRGPFGEAIRDLATAQRPEQAHSLGRTPDGQIGNIAAVASEQRAPDIRTAKGITNPKGPFDVEFTVPKMPWEPSSPWIAPHPPASRPPRDFALDYSKTPLTDEGGNLLVDMDGNPLTAKYIAGRRTIGGKDQGLTSKEIYSLLTKDLDAEMLSVPRSSLPQGIIGQAIVSPIDPPTIKFWGDMPQDQIDTTIHHEFGHVLDNYAGQLPTEGLEDELNMLYSELATGRSGPPYLLPEMRRYRPDQVPREKMAEAFRAQMTNPNMIKSIAPKTAARIRTVNKLPFFSKYIQFNGIPLGLAVGAGAAAMMGKESESHAQQHSQNLGVMIQDIKPGLRKIARALLARQASYGGPR